MLAPNYPYPYRKQPAPVPVSAFSFSFPFTFSFSFSSPSLSSFSPNYGLLKAGLLRVGLPRISAYSRPSLLRVGILKPSPYLKPAYSEWPYFELRPTYFERIGMNESAFFDSVTVALRSNFLWGFREKSAENVRIFTDFSPNHSIVILQASTSSRFELRLLKSA